jgi:hypothetical protein
MPGPAGGHGVDGQDDGPGSCQSDGAREPGGTSRKPTRRESLDHPLRHLPRIRGLLPAFDRREFRASGPCPSCGWAASSPHRVSGGQNMRARGERPREHGEQAAAGGPEQYGGSADRRCARLPNGLSLRNVLSKSGWRSSHSRASLAWLRRTGPGAAPSPGGQLRLPRAQWRRLPRTTTASFRSAHARRTRRA